MEDSISVCAVRCHRMTLFWLIRVKKSLPEKYKNRPETSLVTGLVSATLATVTCYPLDTIRRQMQMKGTPYRTVLDAFVGMYNHQYIVFLELIICWENAIHTLVWYSCCIDTHYVESVTFCVLPSARNISQIEKVILEIKLNRFVNKIKWYVFLCVSFELDLLTVTIVLKSWSWLKIDLASKINVVHVSCAAPSYTILFSVVCNGIMTCGLYDFRAVVDVVTSLGIQIIVYTLTIAAI